MRILPVCGLLLALSAPVLAQSAAPQPPPAPASSASMSPSPAMPANGSDPSVDYSALRENLAARNKMLTDKVNTQRALVKKNQDLLKEAQKLDAANKKLEAEQQRLEAQNADLQKQRDALKAAQPKTDMTASESSMATPAVMPDAPAPAK